MRISQMKDLIKENYRKQMNPLFFHGSPGIGKTDGVEQAIAELAKETGHKLILRTIILSQYESVDLRGLPSIKSLKGEESDATTWNPPDDLMFPPDAKGIVFFDEMSNATQDVQKATQQIIHARRLGNLKIPPGIGFIAAGNRQSDKAGATKLLTALANRFEHHDIEVDHEDWIKWAMAKGIDHSIISFIAWQPSKLNDFDSNQHVNATPRSWEKIHHLLGSSLFENRVMGIIGKGIGAEFLGYCKMWRELPDTAEIWKNPEKVKMPDKQDIVYATAMSLALKADGKNFPNALKFMKKAGKDMQVIFIKYACQANKDVRNTQEFRDYLKTEKEVVFG